jgi:outer membrane protein OmpA-like peptidoglycan-associated protein
MKRLCLLLLVLVSAVAVAQEQPAPNPQVAQRISNVAEHGAAGPTYSDLNCAGFISKENYHHGNYLLAGSESPAATQFAQRDTVYLEGSGYTEGERYSIIRELRDPNRNPAFPAQGGAISAVGQPYQELGHVRVTAIRGKTAIAKVEFSCTAMVTGDLVVPFVEKQPVAYRNAEFERYPTNAGSINGRILMAKEFDVVLGTGQKVYLNVGSSHGVKVGDYFRAVRGYDPGKVEPVEAVSYKQQQSEDTMKVQPRVANHTYGELPRRAVGEMIVLSVTPTSATAMITRAVEHIDVGDGVELENIAAEQPPAPAPVPQAPPQPPTVSCTVNPSSVRSGDPSTITAVGQSPDNRPLTYAFTATGGRITPSGAQATLDTVGAAAGAITVNCTATDDRGLSASTRTTVNIAEAVPQASKCGTFDFSRDKRRPARVDNVAKANLDDCALRLQQDPSAHIVIVGNADPNEKNAPKMAEQRANNTKDYLVREKGIDPSRIELRTGSAGTQTVDVWVVPTGATFQAPQ